MLRALRLPCLVILASLIPWPAFAQQPQAKKKAPNPAYAQIEDVAGLPRVLLIGDSISIGYTVAVREELKGKANVHRPATNCGPTTRGV
ncbi:MAG TPA: SGNH/GDSL hydrolase family protein, partial [Pirellulaceae bacterium]|nr:SGNH/GDSL hydrolase family protein [Pirellulaceae bacterium]